MTSFTRQKTSPIEDQRNWKNTNRNVRMQNKTSEFDRK